MTGRLDGKVAIVVGAGQFPGESVGIGRATVLRFMQEGASVLAVDRSIASAAETLSIAGDNARDSQIFQADVTDTESLRRAANRRPRLSPQRKPSPQRRPSRAAKPGQPPGAGPKGEPRAA